MAPAPPPPLKAAPDTIKPLKSEHIPIMITFKFSGKSNMYYNKCYSNIWTYRTFWAMEEDI